MVRVKGPAFGEWKREADDEDIERKSIFEYEGKRQEGDDCGQWLGKYNGLSERVFWVLV